jgi:tRNA 2-thiocytidine biosynthesis protein TtcA
MDPCLFLESLEQNTRYQKLRKGVTKAIADHQLIAPHDKLMVAVSGGKDSAVLYVILLDIMRRAPYPFSLTPVILDQKQPGFNLEAFRTWINAFGSPLQVIEQDTYSIVKEKTPAGKTYCGLCSRLRRGILYNYAVNKGFHKIVLGHHRDDVNTTLLLNAFYNGSLASMPAKLISQDQRNVVIRPLIATPESETAFFAREWEIPLIPCNLCGSQENLQRQEIGRLLRTLEVKSPHLGESLFAAQSNVKHSLLPGGLLVDTKDKHPLGTSRQNSDFNDFF